MKLRIKSNGTSLGTEIYNENGDRLGLVQKVTWSVGVEDQLARCTIELLATGIDVEVEHAETVSIMPDPKFQVPEIQQKRTTTPLKQWVDMTRVAPGEVSKVSSTSFQDGKKVDSLTKKYKFVNTEFDKITQDNQVKITTKCATCTACDKEQKDTQKITEAIKTLTEFLSK